MIKYNRQFKICKQYISNGFIIFQKRGEIQVPTINQLVRKGRKSSKAKSTAPALQHGYNSKNKRVTNQRSPQKKEEYVLL